LPAPRASPLLLHLKRDTSHDAILDRADPSGGPSVIQVSAVGGRVN